MEFKLPIQYIEHHEISNTIKNDLEMNVCYEKIIGNSSLLDQWTHFYTADKSYLEDTQQIIKHINVLPIHNEEMLKDYDLFNSETNFKDKYQYINIELLEPLNRSILFLQALSLYNISSPIFSLCTPIFIFIVPFFILRLKNIKISGSEYGDLLKNMLKNTNMYRLFYSNDSITFQQKTSVFVSILFYIFQIYQNIISCIQFYKNIHHISSFIESYKKYCIESIHQIHTLNSQLQSYPSYHLFINENKRQQSILQTIVNKMALIFPYSNTFSRLSQIGYIMSLYYSLFYNESYNKAFCYSKYVNIYIRDLTLIQCKYKSKKLNLATFKPKKTNMKAAYYLANINDKPIKNNIKINKNIIITGPNASGKTTLLKSVLLNIIMSQQLGLGCYKKANIHLYNHFHSYLNIPDTSGRDSLFQAEARRCKDILEHIENNLKDRHFCIFDELYSGTNPNDAVLCAEIYLKGLFLFKSVDFMLTTHYIQLCEQLDKHVSNLKMNVIETKGHIEYLYKIEKGISYIHGGKQILKDLNYPEYLFNL
jgi:energy-coupling factor transporter ATP-binding protein EcfA2